MNSITEEQRTVPEPSLKVGDILKSDYSGELFLLCKVGGGYINDPTATDKYVAVNLKSGNRWCEPSSTIEGVRGNSQGIRFYRRDAAIVVR